MDTVALNCHIYNEMIDQIRFVTGNSDFDVENDNTLEKKSGFKTSNVTRSFLVAQIFVALNDTAFNTNEIEDINVFNNNDYFIVLEKMGYETLNDFRNAFQISPLIIQDLIVKKFVMHLLDILPERIEEISANSVIV